MAIPKEGSRKRQVYDALKAKGADNATALGSSLGLAAGTVKSWLGSWNKGGAPAPAKSAARGPVVVEHDYCYTSRHSAQLSLDAKAKLNRMSSDCFSVLEKDGKFAVVAAHHDPAKKPGVFKKGDAVADKTSPEKKGVVTQSGPEVSEVRFADGLRNVNNLYLMHVELPVSKTGRSPAKAASAAKPVKGGKKK